MPTNDPAEKVLGEGQTPTPQPEKEPEKNEIEEIRETVGTLADNVEKLTDTVRVMAEEKTIPEPEPEPKKESFIPNTWDDVDKRIDEKTKTNTRAILEERDKEIEDQRAEKEKARQVIDKDLDDQLTEMEKSGMITSIKDPDADDDPGKAQRREIFAYGAKLGTTNLKEVAERLKREHEAGYEFVWSGINVKSGKFIRKQTSGFGKTVPIASSSPRGPATKAPIPYKDLHNLSTDELIRRAGV